MDCGICSRDILVDKGVWVASGEGLFLRFLNVHARGPEAALDLGNLTGDGEFGRLAGCQGDSGCGILLTQDSQGWEVHL